MYDLIYKCLLENKIIYPNQFSFQFGFPTDYAIIQIINQIFEVFENNLYTLGVFINLSKALDTVDETILIKKFKLYGIRVKNHN